MLRHDWVGVRSRHAVCCYGGDVRRWANGALPLWRGGPACRHAGRAAFSAFDPGEKNMHIVTNVGPLAALIAGILILVVPRLLNYIVALYLIIIGLLGLFGDHIR
jgi:hypothetical protein